MSATNETFDNLENRTFFMDQPMECEEKHLCIKTGNAAYIDLTTKRYVPETPRYAVPVKVTGMEIFVDTTDEKEYVAGGEGTIRQLTLHAKAEKGKSLGNRKPGEVILAQDRTPAIVIGKDTGCTGITEVFLIDKAGNLMYRAMNGTDTVVTCAAIYKIEAV